MSLNLASWTRPDRGALFVVTGASGSGKTTLVQQALRLVPHLSFSVSMTTRAPRLGEEHGRDYFFVDPAGFDAAVAAGELLEWAQVYGNRYGTPRAPVMAALAEGRSVLLDVDDKGATLVRAALPEAVSIFVLPPSIEALEARLRARSTDSEAVIAGRVAEARLRCRAAVDFDYLVVNDDLASAHDQFQAVLVAELLRRSRNPSLLSRFGA